MGEMHFWMSEWLNLFSKKEIFPGLIRGVFVINRTFNCQFIMPNPTQKELQKIAKSRLAESKLLFKNRKYDGARYMIGYTIETALKVRICKLLDLDEYPPKIERKESFKTHSIDALVVLAGLSKELDKKKFDDPAFATNWSVATQGQNGWNETLRYEIGKATRQSVFELINAVSNRNHGIFTWIKSKW